MAESLLYKPLPHSPNSRFIRVLDVQAALHLEGFDEPIRSKLRIINIDASPSPRFSAISYVWGEDKGEPLTIFCGEHLVSTLPNLHSALKFLRKKLGSFTLWVDAICIDQADIKDKEKQIPMMGDIYMKAEFVYVWLGEGSAKTQRALAYLGQPPFMSYFLPGGLTEGVEPRPRSWLALWAYLSSRDRFFPSTGHRRKFHLVDSKKATLEDINSVLDVEWIRRIWTYQEIILATNPVIVCGDNHTPWLCFAFSIMFLASSGINLRTGKPQIPCLNSWAKIVLSQDFMLNIPGKYHAPNGYTSTMAMEEGSTPSPSRELPPSISVANESSLTLLQKYLRFTKSIMDNAGLICIPFNILSALLLISLCGWIPVGIFALFYHLDPTSYPANPIGNNWRLLWAFVAWVALAIIGLAALLFLHSVTGKTPLIEEAFSMVKVDLIDGLCTRQAKHDHDKAFAMRQILIKLASFKISTPDYSRTITDTYRDLNLNLFRTLGCSQFLLPAAMNPLEGCPSWMPDWSKQVDAFWWSQASHQLFDHTQGYKQTDTAALLSDGRLCLSAYRYGQVLICCKFLSTSDTIQEDDYHLHLQNLEGILELLRLNANLSERYHEWVTRIATLCLINGTDADGNMVQRWLNFLYKKRNESTGEVLRLVLRDPRIAKTQLSVCNSFARSNRQLISYCSDVLTCRVAARKHSTKEVSYQNWFFGICSQKVQKGDGVVVIFGTPLPFIIRDNFLVSPAVLRGSMKLYSWRGQYRKDSASVVRIVLK